MNFRFLAVLCGAAGIFLTAPAAQAQNLALVTAMNNMEAAMGYLKHCVKTPEHARLDNLEANNKVLANLMFRELTELLPQDMAGEQKFLFANKTMNDYYADARPKIDSFFQNVGCSSQQAQLAGQHYAFFGDHDTAFVQEHVESEMTDYIHEQLAEQPESE